MREDMLLVKKDNLLRTPEDKELFSEEFCDVFKKFLQTKTNNERTCFEYSSYVYLLCHFVNKDFFNITEKDALLYMQYLTDRYNRGDKISRNTISNRFYFFSSLSKYILDNYGKEYIKDNSFTNISIPKVNDYVETKDIIKLEELDNILSTSKGMDYMYFVILVLAYRTCLKATEILRLTTNNFLTYEKASSMHKNALPNSNDNTLFLYIYSNSRYKDDTCIPLSDDVSDIVSYYLLKCFSYDIYNKCIVDNEYVEYNTRHDVDVSSRFYSIKFDNMNHLFYNKRNTCMTIRNLDAVVNKIIKESSVLNKYTLQDIRNRGILDLINSDTKIVDIKNYVNLKDTRMRALFDASIRLVDECPADAVNFRVRT